MIRRFPIGLATLIAGVLTYYYVLDVIDKKRAHIQLQMAGWFDRRSALN